MVSLLCYRGAENATRASMSAFLKQAVPGVDRVAVLWVPGAVGERTDKDMLNGGEVAGRALGVQLQFVDARGLENFDRAFSDMTSARGWSDCAAKRQVAQRA